MKPLEGVRIVELARVLACPFADMILAELGAEVIKIEQPGSGDETRGYEPFIGADAARAALPPEKRDDEAAIAAAIGVERSGYFYACNRGKLSVTANLRSEAGRAVVRDLIGTADVLIENFPTGGLRKYGLDWPSVKAGNQRLIYVSCTGFGQKGPMASRKGYDTVFQAMGGLMSLTGEKGGGPVKPGLPIADLSSGLWIAIGILSMLTGRSQTGRGGYLDFAMLDGQISLLTLAAARHFALGEVPARLGTEHPGRVPSATFRCRDGGFVHITGADQHWAPLCRLLDIADWGADPRFATNSGRVRHRAEVMARLEEAIAGLSRAELCDACDAAGVPAGPVRDLAEVLHDEQVADHRLVREFDHPEAGTFPGLALPFRFEGFDDPDFLRPPTLGEHTDAVLRDRLGYTPERIAALRSEGAI
ncbi:CaiB/BaiF CoA transferase family protein [Marinibaculum pumilum]|uniref:CaiB/BaiF CoA transferase family protein n=1 Tax=Marinibaculum pumilum TaxID=1766165 RepID=A0ABV7L3P9_9PROT